MKLIDADRLIAEIERRYKEYHSNWEKTRDPYLDGKADALDLLLPFITSLQQEQLVNKDLGTLITCDIIEMTVKRAIDKPQDKEKEVELMTRKINYLRSLEENCVQQEQHEQPEVDLEKEIMKWQGYEAFPEGTNITPLPKAMDIVKRTARHFYELGLNARKV